MQRISRPHGRRFVVCLVSLLAAFAPRPLSAHDGLDEQIARLTAEIATAPTAELLVKRAELHREARHLTQALVDLDRATALDPQILVADFIKANVLLDSGRAKAAEEAATRFLRHQPNHTGALVIRARARARLHLIPDADADFARALGLRPLPELYIERARLFSGGGRKGIERAVQGLDEGIARLGPIATLELEAIDLELRLERYETALARVDRASSALPRKEEWLRRRGSILERAGRAADARAAYQSALAAIAALPSWTRATPSSTSLQTRLHNDLRRLDKSTKQDRQ